MRVLIIYHAGAAEHSRRIFQAMAQDDNVTLTVVVPRRLKVAKAYDPSGWLSVEKQDNSGGYRLVPIPLRNPQEYRMGFHIKSLYLVLRQTQPDIIQVLDEVTSGYLYQVILLRFIASRRSKILFYSFENIPIRMKKLSRLKWKMAWFQVSGGATANTEALENLKRMNFPLNRPLQRIFWGIPTDIFKPMDSITLKKELNLDHGHIVGFVGRFVPEKGLRTLLSAICYLPDSVHCVIIGSGPMQRERGLCSKLPKLHGRIHIFDAMKPETLVKYINCMDVLAAPSLTTARWKEQYGRVIAEAMASGIPVVGSDSGAIPEVIGTSGLIVPEADPQALAEALRSAIFDTKNRQHLIASGLQRAREELSVRAMVQQLLKLYSRVLQDNE